MRPAPTASSAGSRESRPWVRSAVAAACLAVAALLGYHNSFQGAFVFDDDLAIPQNPTLEHLTTAWVPPAGSLTVSGRPLLNVSFALNRAISGNAVWSYHALNLLIHVATALALYAIIRRTLASPALSAQYRSRATTLALAGATLWVLHPVQTESVTYIVQRAESLCALWILLTLVCFIASVERPASALRWRVGAVACCLLGMLTKEVAVITPLLVALYDRTFAAGSWRRVWERRRGFHLALVATWTLLVGLVLSTGGRAGTFDFAPASWWRYDLTQVVALAQYLKLTLWPAPLVIDYGTFWIDRLAILLPPGLLLAAVVAATVLAWRRSPALGFLGVAFCLTLTPSSLPPGTIQMIVEHRMYLALAAPVLLFVFALDRLLGPRFVVAIAGIVLAFAALTARRNQDYATPVRLFTDTVAKRPGNARAWALLGDYQRRAGDRISARQSLEQSLTIDPSVPEAWNNLGNVRLELGNPAAAVEAFGAAVARRPEDPTFLKNLGASLVLAGRASEGVSRLEAALRHAPDSASVLATLANALAETGRLPEAARHFERLLPMVPTDLAAHANYAQVLLALDRPLAAAAVLKSALQLAPDHAELHNRLGVALGQAGRTREAWEEFQAALRLDPTHTEARENAAIAGRRLGR